MLCIMYNIGDMFYSYGLVIYCSLGSAGLICKGSSFPYPPFGVFNQYFVIVYHMMIYIELTSKLRAAVSIFFLLF